MIFIIIYSNTEKYRAMSVISMDDDLEKERKNVLGKESHQILTELTTMWPKTISL